MIPSERKTARVDKGCENYQLQSKLSRIYLITIELFLNLAHPNTYGEFKSRYFHPGWFENSCLWEKTTEHM